jgi:predicted HicB family RNase H-like nuclease
MQVRSLPFLLTRVGRQPILKPDTRKATAMTVTLELTPDVQAGLLAEAQASGLSLEAYAEQLLRERSQKMGT